MYNQCLEFVELPTYCEIISYSQPRRSHLRFRYKLLVLNLSTGAEYLQPDHYISRYIDGYLHNYFTLTELQRFEVSEQLLFEWA